MKTEFPRLLYIGDVSVELANAGSTLLYRLFQHYPKDRLRIVQSIESHPSRSLPGVQYDIIKNRLSTRLRKTRFNKLGSLMESALARTPNKKIQNIIREFQPDSIITVSFRLLWIQAYLIARKNHLPFFLILHDDILTAEFHGPMVRKLIAGHLQKAYSQAIERFCISANMERMYFEKYKQRGQVIYPMMSKDDKILPVTMSRTGSQLTFCYAGSIYTPDFPQLLNEMANLLGKAGHKLVLFTEATRNELESYTYLQEKHVELNTFIHPDELQTFMRNSVDVNILINSFQLELPFKWNFSSKLVEYTKVGLPVLAWGPETSGAINWMITNNYQGVVSDRSLEKLNIVIRELSIPGNRITLGNHFQQIGTETFDYDRNFNVLIKSLTKS
jgi:hypothetical protein